MKGSTAEGVAGILERTSVWPKMNHQEQRRALRSAVSAALSAGALMHRNAHATKKIAVASRHDIKLELDVQCQKLIERGLLKAFPQSAVLGEEGVLGQADAEERWVVDPIDGTVNFTYGIPHACVSVALQLRTPGTAADFQTVVGVVYDPFCGELWTGIRGQPARLNGRPVRVSDRTRLSDTVVSIGFGKEARVLNQMLPMVGQLVHRVRKIRIMGSAALALAYVASGRFDAYVEPRLRLWDIAAGGLIVECAGGDYRPQPIAGEHAYYVTATNGRLTRTLERRLAAASA
jgi:myo-inositol-1(or 4)-monophosphatase